MLVIFNILESEVLDANGKTGYLQLNGSVLFGLIIIVVNLKILTMSTGVKVLNTFLVFGSIVFYWVTQVIYGKLGDLQELVIF